MAPAHSRKNASRQDGDEPHLTIPPPPPGSTRALTQKDLATARSLASFPVEKVTNLIYGSPEAFQRKKQLEALVEREPVFSRKNRHHGSRKDRLVRALAMSKRMVELRDAHKLSDDDMWVVRRLIDETLPVSLHEGMFLPVLRTQCSPEQAKHWVPLAEQYKIIGSYAQTELAHGSNLSGLETTATYIPETDEFELHMPDITATKWWIGSLGVISTHTLVQAKLILRGKDYGPHLFIVPLRSLEDHKPFPGVRVGDIGPKLGFNLIDNGWLILKHYRIPRTHMLMRFAQVTATGEYKKPPHAKIAYSGMVFIRVYLVRQAALALARASTISVRYAAMRRQFAVVNTAKQVAGMSSSEETPVLMYPMVQARMFPRIAESYAILFAAGEIESMYTDMMQRIESFDVSTLPIVHAQSSALKSFCTGLALDGIEEVRRSTGGHGYLVSSGLPYLLCNYTPNVTFEGENFLLTQQTARYLLKSLHKHQTQSEPLHPLVEYLELVGGSGVLPAGNVTGPQVNAPTDWFNPATQLAAFAHRAARLAGELAYALSHEGLPFADLNVECARLSKAHSQYMLVRVFHKVILQQLQDPKKVSVYPVLKLLSDVFALNCIEAALGDFTEDGYLTQTDVRHLRTALKIALDDMLRDAVALVDAWEFSDYELDSALGRKDGKVYEELLQRALDDPVNQGMAGKAVARGYEQYIRPLLRGDREAVSGASVTKSKL